jgi:uncharacterized protein
MIILISGLTVFGFGEALLIQSKIGNSPWSVLAQGVSLHTPLSIGTATFLISGVVLSLWIPLRERPGLGTFCNIFFIALALQIGVDLLPSIHNDILISFGYVGAGIVLVGVGSAIYLTCGLGPGPRDGLMTAIHHRTGVRVSRVRLGIEITVLTIGWFLGGKVGIGTALFALFIGLSIAFALNLISKVTQNRQSSGS